MIAGFRAILVKFALFAGIAGLLGYIIVNTMVHGLSGPVNGYEAEFSDVAGLRVGDDVRVAGVRVGRVQSIAIAAGGAEVGFDLIDEQPLLDNTKIVMRYQNLLGQRYLALVQEQKRGAELKPGATVPLARTSPGFDLTELLNGFRPLFEALRPADVNKLATSVVQVLQGEGGTVASLLEQTADLTGFLADRDELVGKVVDNLTPVLTDLAAQGSQFSGTVIELRRLVTGLARDRKSIGTSIESMGQLVGATSDLLSDLRAPAIAAVSRFNAVMELFLSRESDFVKALGSFGDAISALGRATSYRNGVNLYVCSLILDLGIGKLNLNGGENGPWSEVCR